MRRVAAPCHGGQVSAPRWPWPGNAFRRHKARTRSSSCAARAAARRLGTGTSSLPLSKAIATGAAFIAARYRSDCAQTCGFFLAVPLRDARDPPCRGGRVRPQWGDSPICGAGAARPGSETLPCAGVAPSPGETIGSGVKPRGLNLTHARSRRRAGGHPRNVLRAPQSWCAHIARAARRAGAPRPFLRNLRNGHSQYRDHRSR